MKRADGKPAGGGWVARVLMGALAWLTLLSPVMLPRPDARAAAGPQENAGLRAGAIDTHGHLQPSPSCGYDAALEEALEAMQRYGIRQTLIMPAPHPAQVEGLPGSQCADYKALAPLAARHPGRFAFLGGGATLNPMIHAVASGEADLESTLPSFVTTADEILRYGAVGFGELAAEHLSFRPGHPYISAPPHHPLFLLLADIAASHDVPIDLHMEAVAAEDLPLPGGLQSPPNPGTLTENISALERLLAHNRDARIVWAHAGWDNTGERTVALMRRLLRDHPNLYMNIKLRPRNVDNRPTDAAGRLRAGWLDLLRSFPDRFTLGLDAKYPEDTADSGLFQLTEDFLSQLPPDLANKVGHQNTVRIYQLGRRAICHAPGTPGERTLRVDAQALEGHLGHGDRLGPCL
ncbi:MAG: amidohydrolase family protein [Deltaproteobacteria bacterium]|nr:amidohydrolase family protein [Deltaproteobacteria bacterium]